MRRLEVVVPVYNVEKYLRKCLDSLLAQSLMPDRVLLIDDGSTDSSGEICEEYASRHPFFHVVHQENAGLSAARNAGLDLVESRYVGFVDSDDYIDASFYQRHLEAIERYGADVTLCNVMAEYSHGQRAYTRVRSRLVEVWSPEEALIRVNTRRISWGMWSKVFAYSLFGGKDDQDKLRFPLGKLAEDKFVLPRLLSRAHRIAFLPEPLYHYVRRSDGIMHRDVAVVFDTLEAADEQLAFFQARYPRLVPFARAWCAMERMAGYERTLEGGFACPDDVLRTMRDEARTYLPDVMRNFCLSPKRALKTLLFCCSLPAFKRVVARRLKKLTLIDEG